MLFQLVRHFTFKVSSFQQENSLFFVFLKIVSRSRKLLILASRDPPSSEYFRKKKFFQFR